ncbi:MAG: MM0924 family protein [Blastocatellia bacterium]
MRNLLEAFLDREIEVNCGATTFSGKVVKVDAGVLQIQKDDVLIYINLDKVIAVSESREKKSITTPGIGFKAG